MERLIHKSRSMIIEMESSGIHAPSTHDEEHRVVSGEVQRRLGGQLDGRVGVPWLRAIVRSFDGRGPVLRRRTAVTR